MKSTVRSLEDTAIELSNEAVAFVEKNKDKPFFLFYPTTNIHFPLTPNSRFNDSTKAGVYGEFVVEFDWAVGELLGALDRHDLADNTIVVLTSDNGARPHEDLNGHLCNGPWRGTKRQITIGGRKVQSGLHRVTYVGGESTAAVEPPCGGAACREPIRFDGYYFEPSGKPGLGYEYDEKFIVSRKKLA